MRYFHSNKNFNQYKPAPSFWEKFKKKRQKRDVLPTKTPDLLLNPFKREKPTPKNYKKIFITAFILLIFLGWLTLTLTLPYFKINNIVITGTKISKPQEIENYVRYGDYFKDGLISRKNYFLFQDKAVAQKVQDKFLYEKVEIKKVFPNTINIIISEKPASIIYDNNGKIYLLDKDGKIIKKTEFGYNLTFLGTATNSTTTSTPTLNTNSLVVYQKAQIEYGNFPIINDYRTIELSGEKILSAKLIESALIWQKYLKEQAIGEVKFFSTDETDFNLKINLDKPWHILINTQNDSAAEMRNLRMILSNNNPTSYIDLRFGDRVYWK
ncbi:MAG: hypothetical protein HY979_02310 [Candidatus Magasanikbacteria bacterium]|nr:hypothetical protein [Candidatus Magasanikbacteria bacterium]